jgi:hypothetical protein
MAQLPGELQWFTTQTAQIVAAADLRAGIREVMWGRAAQGEFLLKRATFSNSSIDQSLLRLLVDQLLNYQRMVGDDAAQAALHRLTKSLRTVAAPRAVQWMAGCYWLNRGLQRVQHADYSGARANILQAFQADPTTMRNRGAWSTLVKTLKPVPPDKFASAYGATQGQ